MLWSHFSVLLVVAIQVQYSVAPDVGTAVDALDKAKDVLSKGGKLSVLTKVLKYGQTAAFVGTAVKEIISIIRSFGPGDKESKELKYLKEQFAIVNTKLDALDHDFEEVKNLIDWNSMKINVGEYEATINALYQKFQLYMEAPLEAKRIYEDSFKNDYHYNYNDAPLKVYLLLASKGTIFQDNIFEVVSKFFKYDIRRVAEFAAYMLRLIQKGLYLNTAFLKLDNQEDRLAVGEKEWQERYEKLTVIAKEVDNKIIEKWSTQYRSDCDEYAARNSHLGNKDMADGLFKFLSEKYPWRGWMVIVYTFTNNNDKDRYYDNCGGFDKVNVGNKVVIVNTYPIEKKSPRINLYRFYDSISGLQGLWSPHEVIAKRLYKMVTSSCDFYTFRGVVEEKAATAIASTKGRCFKTHVNVLRAFHSLKKYHMIVCD